MQKVKLGITIGDINGVGPEVIIKALSNPSVSEMFTPVIYGSSKVLSYHKNIVKTNFSFSYADNADRLSSHKINCINCWNDQVDINIGQSNEAGGKYAYIALDRAVNDLKEGKIDGLVTAPINKKTMSLANFPYPGHTEFLTETFKVKNSLMMMCSEDLKIALVSNHLPINQVAEAVTKEKIQEKLNTLHVALKRDFGIEKPTIAVLGLNPHAGDGGLIGMEEEEIIRPVIIEAKKKGMVVMGPYPADGFFGSSQFNKFDAILAMYHDQGLIPFKALTFGSGVNFTAGLPHVRTSPDHGTAYDIAGQNVADPSSMRSAIFTALDLVRNRKQYQEDHSNALRSKEKEGERG